MYSLTSGMRSPRRHIGMPLFSVRDQIRRHIHRLAALAQPFRMDGCADRVGDQAAGYPVRLPRASGKSGSPSYYAGASGGAPPEILKQYIRNQQTPESRQFLPALTDGGSLPKSG